MSANDVIEEGNPHSNELINGVVIGIILGVDRLGNALVIFPENLGESAITARSIVSLTELPIGCEVALSFESGDPSKPIILGRMMRSTRTSHDVEKTEDEPTKLRCCLESRGDRELVLRCGKASITLTRSGKIILRGTYISSRSSGVIRIKGGSVQIN